MDRNKRKPETLGLKPKGALQWYRGRLCPIRKENAWFLKPMAELPKDYPPSKDVFMYPNYISEFVLPVVEGDMLEFILGDRDKTRPMAQKVRVAQYSRRTCKELIEYIRKLIQDLNTVNFKKVLVQALPCTAMWRFLGSPVFEGVPDADFTSMIYVEELISLLKLILHLGKPFKTLLEDVIKTVTRGTMFQATNDRSLPAIIKSCTYSDGNDRFCFADQDVFFSAELVRSFCHDAIRQVPAVTRCLLPTVTAVSGKIASPSTQNFLCALLSFNSAGENAFIADANVWMELPLIPTDHELAGHLVEKDKHLSRVRTNIPYDNPDQYMDTYFRLVRAETFSAMQHGIKDLKASKLDLRDMNVYYNLHLAGFALESGRFSLAIHFTPTKIVKKWEASPQLMYGNLVCVSINRKFDDVIWATVSNRDTDLLNKDQIIMLELLDENIKSVSEIISSLQTQRGSAIMVESPTYYHSLSPILRSLKDFDMEDFPLQEEIVYARPALEMPSYLKGATCHTLVLSSSEKTTLQEVQEDKTEAGIYFRNMLEADRRREFSESEGEDLDSLFDEEAEQSEESEECEDSEESTLSTTCFSDSNSSDISSDRMLGERMDVEHFLEIFKPSLDSSLESSQCEALTHALKNKLAVIQGPPGCGKTFIGVKIVQLLLSLSPKLEKPILLLTYKNHALDEFLKHMIGFCQIDELVRIGGRSKEPELESCNLKRIQNQISFDKATQVEIQNTRNEIAEIETKIRKIAVEVEASSFLTQKSLVEELTEEQLESLLLEAAWGTKPMLFRTNKNNNLVDKSWIKRKLRDVIRNFGSVKEFLQTFLETKIKRNPPNANAMNVFQKAFHEWFPDRSQLQRVKEFQAEFILQIESDKTADEEPTKASEDEEDDDSGDEDYVKQLLETRMASGSKYDGRSVGDLILFNAAKAKNRNDILVEISDYSPDMAVSSQIRSVNNLWSLNETQRLQFLYCILNEKTISLSQELNNLLEQLQSLKNRRQELEMNDKVELLSTKKIIGVTITGASINHDLIHQIGPSVVIVEEAAEILEPSLLAALTPSIEHLILIGDHKQLRPQVDTYDLCRNFLLDVSMMERLIESGFPYKSLTKQNRMRPEFSALLHDIYPNLEDNLPLVSKNKTLKCIEKSMFFWSHYELEKKDRTYSNVKEAERVVALVLYLLCNGCLPSEITVLAAYLGQTKLLRSMLKQEKAKKPKFFQEGDGRNKDSEGFVQVQTVDMYQGDENKYVIISLVRSNEENRIGFLNRMNRRCVAQSRAKCGMYFVGNANTLCGAKDSCWSEFITAMVEQDCVAKEFPLQCVKHEVSKYKALDGNSIRELIAKPRLLCNQLCGAPYPSCDEHPCKMSCIPKHRHKVCPKMISDQFPGCGHDVKRPCPKNISDLQCRKTVIVDLPCGHKGTKKCYESFVICRIPVTATFPRCGHQIEKECHVAINNMTCTYPCSEMNFCGEHLCKEVCGKSHGHDRCPDMIDYQFPKCGHFSSKKKKCCQEITWKCTSKVYFDGACGHKIEKECHQIESEVKCKVKPCGKIRQSCGHPCTNACGDDCEKGDCKHCQRVYQKKMEEFRAAARARVKELEEKIAKKKIPSFSRDEIRGTGATAAEYQKVKDQVLKFIQPCHKWFPHITRIEKVTNLVLEKKFEAAKSRAFGDNIDMKFHGTSNDGVRGIVRKGFKMPEAKPRPSNRPSMFGQGIYFATDSSKSAQEIYTKGSRQLLLCQVILGKSMTVEKADYTLNRKNLRSNHCDSVYAPRGTAVKNDEFVIFDSDQALPQYVIHFADSKTFVPPSPTQLSTQTFFRKNMKASRVVNIQDPFELYYSFAESHFLRMTAKGNRHLSATISSIDIVINKDLEYKFEATKQKLKSQGIPDQEILAYHGTDKKNIDSILKSNLQLSYAKRQAYGKGNYFSEFPAVSLGYGDGLLLCRILPGKEFVDSSSSDIPQDYNSKKVLRSQPARVAAAMRGQPLGAGAAVANTSGEIIIIENSDQILPFFVIHR